MDQVQGSRILRTISFGMEWSLEVWYAKTNRFDLTRMRTPNLFLHVRGKDVGSTSDNRIPELDCHYAGEMTNWGIVPMLSGSPIFITTTSFGPVSEFCIHGLKLGKVVLFRERGNVSACRVNTFKGVVSAHVPPTILRSQDWSTGVWWIGYQHSYPFQASVCSYVSPVDDRYSLVETPNLLPP